MKLITLALLSFAALIVCNAQTTIPIRNRYTPTANLILATNAQLPFNATNGRTYMFWIYPTALFATDYTIIFTKGQPVLLEERKPSVYFHPNSTRIHFISDTNTLTNSGCNSISSPPLNQWTHIALVHSPSTYTIYHNGVADATCASSGDITTTPDSLGCYDNATTYSYAQATVADLRYYPAAATAAEVARVIAENRYNVDTTPPTLTSVSIASTAYPPAVGSTITVTFNTSEIITTPTVTIFGRSANVLGSSDSRRWTATVAVIAADIASSTATFSISNYLDYLNGNAGATVTSVTDGTVVYMSCNSTIYSPTFFANMSGISSGTLNLVFHAPTFINDTTFTFVGAPQATCHSNNPTYWTMSYPSSPACSTRYSASIPLNFALANCSFLRDESTPGTTFYTSTIKATTVQTLGAIRGLVLSRTLETGIVVRVAFVTTVNATSTSLNVFGPRITVARITKTVFNPINYELTLTLLTSVQSPYQLATPSVTAVSGFTIVSAAPQTAESGAPTVAVCASGTSPCTQYWTIVIRRTTSCSPAPSTLTNSGWLVNFAVGCHSTFTGSCAAVDPNTDAVSFDTASDNYCPVLLDVESATATLTAFDSNAFTNQQSSFVFGARTHFRAVVTGLINIQALRLERVTIVSGGASGVSTLYSSPFTNANAYFSQAPVATYSNQPAGYTGTFSATPTLMTVSDNLAGASALQRVVTFSWIWSGATSSASTDNPVSTLVSADLRIRYANQSTVSDHLITMKWSSQPHLLEAAGAIGSSVAVAVVGSNDNAVNNGGGDAPVTNNDDNSGINNKEITSINVVVATVGFTIALVAVAAIAFMVVKQRKRASLKQSAAVAVDGEQEMTHTSSTSQLNQQV